MASARILHHIDFGANGNSASFTGGGWSEPEANSTWALAPKSVLRVPVPLPGAGRLVLMLSLHPLGHLLSLPHRQTLRLTADGKTLFTGALADSSAIAVPLPNSISGKVVVEITYPDYRSPQDLGVPDPRPLGVYVADAWVIALPQPWSLSQPVTLDAPAAPGAIADRIGRATGVPPEHLMLQFENLGHTGAQPLSLLRFAGLGGAGVAPGADDFLQALKLAEQIFVLRRPTTLLDAEALAVFAALNLRGPNALLVVNGAPGPATLFSPHGMIAGTDAAADPSLNICTLAAQATALALAKLS